MKKTLLWMFVAVFLFAVLTGGCGGGHDDDLNFADDPDQDETIIDEDGSGRGNSGNSSGTITIDCSESVYYYSFGYVARVTVWGRKLIKRNSDGTYKFGKWEVLNGNYYTGKFIVSDEYAEFGFEVQQSSILGSKSYHYSKVFWTGDDTYREQPKTITLAASANRSDYVNVNIKVNDKTVVDDKHLDTIAGHYNCGTFKAMIEPTRKYKSTQTLYGCKRVTQEDGTTKLGFWEKLKSFASSFPEHYVENCDIAKDYVEFGFELDIADGTNWPYSGVFWNATDTARKESGNIDISVGGAVRNTTITIKVNKHEVYHDGNCNSHSQYSW